MRNSKTSSIGIALRDFRGSYELNGMQQLMIKQGDTVVIDLDKHNQEKPEQPQSFNDVPKPLV